MGWRQGARSGAYLNRYVTDEQRSRRPIFIATLRAVASWLFFRVARSTRMNQIWALRSRLEKQPTDPAAAGRKSRYLWDRTLEPYKVISDTFTGRFSDQLFVVAMANRSVSKASSGPGEGFFPPRKASKNASSSSR